VASGSQDFALREQDGDLRLGRRVVQSQNAGRMLALDIGGALIEAEKVLS
jgi:hypothetical protein